MAQTEIGRGKTIQRVPCLKSASGPRRRNRLLMTARCAPVELGLSVPVLPIGVGLDMGGSLVAQRWFPIRPGRSWVWVVLVSSVLEVVGVVRGAVLVRLTLVALPFLVPQSSL